jgi:catechol 2,3-dioxygenase-like lactoylglutathione lyase family enzyme
MFQGILTVAIYVTDMARAKKFYTETLGFEQGWDVHENLSFLKVGNTHVYLEAGYEPSEITDKSARLSFFLEAEKSVKEVFEVLKAKGVNIIQDAPEQVGDEVWWFQFRDPDGNILEVSGKP